MWTDNKRKNINLQLQQELNTSSSERSGYEDDLNVLALYITYVLIHHRKVANIIMSKSFNP